MTQKGLAPAPAPQLWLQQHFPDFSVFLRVRGTRYLTTQTMAELDPRESGALIAAQARHVQVSCTGR